MSDTAGGNGTGGGGVISEVIARAAGTGGGGTAAIADSAGDDGVEALDGPTAGDACDDGVGAAADPVERAETAAMDEELRAAAAADGRAGGVATSSTSESPVREAGDGSGSTDATSWLDNACCACAARAWRAPEGSR